MIKKWLVREEPWEVSLLRERIWHAAVQESSAGSQLSIVHGIRQLIYSHVCIPTNDDSFFPMWLESDLDQHYGWVGSLLQLYFGSCVVICLPQNLLWRWPSLSPDDTQYLVLKTNSLGIKVFREFPIKFPTAVSLLQYVQLCKLSFMEMTLRQWLTSLQNTYFFIVCSGEAQMKHIFTCLKSVNCLIISGIMVLGCWQFNIQS